MGNSYRLNPNKHSWMSNTNTKEIIRVISKGEKESRFVGGCVRDAILNREVHDIDIATTEHPKNIEFFLKEAGIKTVNVGIKHGTILAFHNYSKYEITTLREDVKTNGRHALVNFTNNWQMDAERRDFTFNALSADLEGKVYDYCGGLNDIKEKTIRFVGKATDRIHEDYLRILRYFRFIATLNVKVGDESDFAACITLAHNIKKLSKERVRSEFFKIIDSDFAPNIIEKLHNHNILKQIIPNISGTKSFQTIIQIENKVNDPNIFAFRSIRRLAALMDFDCSQTEEISTALNLSKTEIHYLAQLASLIKKVNINLKKADLTRILYKYSKIALIDSILVKYSKQYSTVRNQLVPREKDWLRIIEIIRTINENTLVFPLKGQDAINLGIPAGPQISKFLKLTEVWWLTKGCRATRDECLSKLRYLINK